MHRLSLRSLLAALVVLLMVLAACAEDDAEEVAEEEDDDEELALDLDDEDDDEAVEEDEPEDDDEAVEEDDDFDVEAAVVDYTTTIPDGWMFIREVDEFEEALSQADDAVIIDVRTEEEVDEDGVIPGSINIDLRDLAQNLEAVPMDRPVYVYCATAWRAGIATSSLRMMGYDNVLGFSPGAPGWEAAGNELTPDVEPLEDFGDPGVEPELVDAVDGFLSTLPEGYLTFPGADNVLEAQEAGATLVDIRQPENFEEGFVEDALTIPIRELATTDEIPTDTDVVIYCQSGWRTSLSMPILHLLGYDNVQGYPGNFDSFADEGAVTS